MTRKQRNWFVYVVFISTYSLLAFVAEAGLWALLITPYGALEFWDGMKTNEEIWSRNND